MHSSNIKMVDLRAQTDAIREEIDYSIGQVIDASQFIKGNVVADFEANLAKHLQAKHVIACGNGTDALQVSLMALGLERGDEVIVPSFTYVASAEVIALLGLIPVFVEVDPLTFNMDVADIQRVLGSKTKAIIPVHLYGQGANMEAIMKIANDTGLKVVEDTAQAISCKLSIGNDQRFAGTVGHIGTFSFFPSKNLGCFGDGGAIVTQDDELAARIRKLANHGQKAKYQFELIGCNSRLDTLQAAVLNVKLKYLSAYNEKRNRAAQYYDQQLTDIEGLSVPYRDEAVSDHVYHQYTIQVSSDKRDELEGYLKDKGIPTQIYYPIPVHLNEAYGYLGYKNGDLPVTEKLSQSVLSLPMHTELTDDQLKYITETIQNYFS